MRVRFLFFCLLLVASPYRASAQTTHPNPVIHWAGVVQQSIHNAAAPRSAGSFGSAAHDGAPRRLRRGGRHRRRIASRSRGRIHAFPWTDVKAAVATAAFITARTRVAASQRAMLDRNISAISSEIPNGWGKLDGVRVGWQAAATILLLRANDRFENVVPYQCSATPPPVEEFEPDTGCPEQPELAAAGRRQSSDRSSRTPDFDREPVPSGRSPATSSRDVRDRLRRDARLRPGRQRVPDRPSRRTSRSSGPRIRTCTGTGTSRGWPSATTSACGIPRGCSRWPTRPSRTRSSSASRRSITTSSGGRRPRFRRPMTTTIRSPMPIRPGVRCCW